nr:DUF3324 domain-containing protein [Weissella cibaria]
MAHKENRTWEPDLTFAGVATKSETGTTNIAINIRNTTGAYLNQLAVEATVTKDGKPYSRKQRDMKMAQNSNFGYMMPLKDNATTGKYAVKAIAYYVKDRRWSVPGWYGPTLSLQEDVDKFRHTV